MQANVTDTIREKATEIQESALNPTGPNCLSRELTYQQALSIALRSEELSDPGGQLSCELRTCYKQRDWE